MKNILPYIFLCFFYVEAVAQDSLQNIVGKDSNQIHETLIKQTKISTYELYQGNKYLHLKKDLEEFQQQKRQLVNKDTLFYIIVFLLLFLVCFKLLYEKYFTNLTRVFFNTTLRQSQLVDQLLLAKLQSLLLNVFFVITAGLFLFLLLVHYGKTNLDQYYNLSICILIVTIVYFLKYISIHFFGWLLGYHQEAESYLFVVFLLNKIIGIFLLPVIICLGFAERSITDTALTITYFLLAGIFVLRYLRTYGLLQHKLKMSRFHFILYITGVEVLPILLIYKEAMFILNKSM